MRKILTYAVSALALASCSSDSLVSDSPANTQAPIAFNAGQKNITRSVDDPSNLEKNGYYNFGVWAYKVNGSTRQNVMANYLVGYNGTNGYPKDGVPASTWYYDGLNSQILRYWDYSYPTTNFYAYAPYDANASFTEENNTITVAATAGYKKTNDVIFAGKSVAKAAYGELVPLQFKHIGAKVNIAFRENIDGYKVQLLNVETGKGVVLKPTGTYNATASVTINYDNPDKPTVNTSTAGSSPDDLEFDIFSGNLPEGADATYKASSTTYYAVIQPEKATNTFILHVSYKLIADDNKEEIVVNDATVTIPANQLEWKSNTAYTYNFTITDTALSPIVFDNPTISDYDNATPYNKDV